MGKSQEKCLILSHQNCNSLLHFFHLVIGMLRISPETFRGHEMYLIIMVIALQLELYTKGQLDIAVLAVSVALKRIGQPHGITSLNESILR